jgi:ABC-type sugar transport system substrate-binding protein
MGQRLPRAEGCRALHCVVMVLILLLLASCNLQRGSVPSKNSSTEGKNPASIHVGFLSETESLDFAQEMAAGAQYAADQYHVSAQIVAPPTFDDPASLKLFHNLVQTARDGIAIETLAPDLFIQAEANALRQGIPLIAVDTPPPPASHITSYIGNDNIAAGKLLADAAIKFIPTNAEGHVLIGIDNLVASILHSRAQGMVQEFRRLRPALQIVGPFNSRQPPEQNLATWNSVITAYPALIACLGVGDADNASLAQIKQEKHGTYLSGAFDLDPTALQAIANGTNFALVDPEHFLKGYVAMRLLIERALYGHAIPQGWWNPGALVVTPSNVQQIIRRQMSLSAKGRFYQPLIDQQFANPAAQIKRLDQAT